MPVALGQQQRRVVPEMTLDGLQIAASRIFEDRVEPNAAAVGLRFCFVSPINHGLSSAVGLAQTGSRSLRAKTSAAMPSSMDQDQYQDSLGADFTPVESVLVVRKVPHNRLARIGQNAMGPGAILGRKSDQ